MRKLSVLVFGALIALAGCATVSKVVENVTTTLSSSSSAQVNSLADAELSYTVIAKAADSFVTSGLASKPVIAQINTLNESVHAVLVQARAANARNDSPALAAAIASFNEARSAFNSYATSQGVSH